MTVEKSLLPCNVPRQSPLIKLRSRRRRQSIWGRWVPGGLRHRGFQARAKGRMVGNHAVDVHRRTTQEKSPNHFQATLPQHHTLSEPETRPTICFASREPTSPTSFDRVFALRLIVASSPPSHFHRDRDRCLHSAGCCLSRPNQRPGEEPLA
jgi:hypothetical protein